MRETNKAKRAFEDFFALGPGRTLAALHKKYTEGEQNPPTKSFRWIREWSRKHNWMDRIAERERRIAEERYEAIVEGSREAGYAYWPKRVEDLNELAEKMFDSLTAAGTLSNFLAAMREFRALLEDIAAEMGGRVKRTEVSGPDAGPIEIEDIEATRERRWKEVAGMLENVLDFDEESEGEDA